MVMGSGDGYFLGGGWSGRFILSGDGCWWVTLDIVSCGGYVLGGHEWWWMW